jgi:hypothetical protein
VCLRPPAAGAEEEVAAGHGLTDTAFAQRPQGRASAQAVALSDGVLRRS